MFKSIYKSLQKNKIDVLVWAFCVGLIIWFLYPILSDRIVAGWDLTGHFYLLTKMVEFLKSGSFTGYDADWFGGYPVFTFYGPLPYVLLALPHVLSFGVIPLNLLFNCFLFFIPFFFLFSIYYTSRVWFGKKVGPIALVFSLFFLLAGKNYAHFGIGLNAEIYLGLFSSIFAISLMVLLLGVFGKQRKKKSNKLILIGGLLLAMIILTHALTTIFTGVLLAVLFLSDTKKLWKPLILTFLLGLALSSFWLIPFLLNLDLTSAQMIGKLPLSRDPLFNLYPKIDEMFSDFNFLMLIPGFVLLICSFMGIIKLFKSKNHFWPYAFVFTLILLPRDYLVNVIDLPLHYYRFVPHIFVLNIFLAAFGLRYILKKITSLKQRSRMIAEVSTLFIVFSSVLVMAFLHFDMKEDYNFFFEEYDDYEAATEMLDYINELNPSGRVAVEIMFENQVRLGTPHFFTNFLPLKYDIPVIPGLLAESSLSSELVMPALIQVSDSLAWGNVELLNEKEFKKQSTSSMIERLGLYNVQYILLDKENADNLFKRLKNDEVSLQKTIGDFYLVELADFKPLIESTPYPPFLFIDEGGMDFRIFSTQWFKVPELFDYPVIYTDKSVDEISDYDLSRIGGFIVSLPEGTPVLDSDFAYLREDNKEVVFLSSDEDIFGLEEVFSKTDASELKNVEIIPEIKEDEYIKFFSESGALINYSYFPRWESTDPEQTVFWATPTMMFVFGKGDTELFYD